MVRIAQVVAKIRPTANRVRARNLRLTMLGR